ncbi:aminoglycoside phosphotransferase family protein [Paenibacillus sp. J2TS4]|uniref:aminoglycoside phosphotransferase family protein n=1 Tax=Paenibacillus sp. J2TS4 TaxID=2807194 RepID=UPI001B1E18C2|nr:aminoglycoside phosphotransferase family protein [Paenibacillus sp. J2TS4]GIP32804.1 aminoglycoside phosphotransferase [Paenibacillus sp. J2TS4]
MENQSLHNMEQYIPHLKGYQDISPIHKGYSSDHKYCVSFQDGWKYLLRMFDLKQREAKKAEFDVLQKMELYSVKCSKPIEFGSVEPLGKGYMLLSYIEGEDAEEHIGKLPEEVQYKIGADAGIELLKMHQCPAPEPVSGWFDRKYKKHRRYMDQYHACGYKLKEDSKLQSFIDDHIELMKYRPNVFQHDDFHVGNLIIKDQQLAGVIDFNSYDWGDPIHEFLKVGFFSSEVSIPFAIGQMTGYHKGGQPDERFWTLYSLYLAMSIYSSIVWILKVKPEELDSMLEKIYRVLEDHNGFESVKPKWYSR